MIKLIAFIGFFLESEVYIMQPLHFSESTFKQKILGKVRLKRGHFIYFIFNILKMVKNLNYFYSFSPMTLFPAQETLTQFVYGSSSNSRAFGFESHHTPGLLSHPVIGELRSGFRKKT